MKHLRIAPKKYISEKFVMDFYDYSKKEALKRYKEKFPSFTTKELEIY
jgi:hypothetical protein